MAVAHKTLPQHSGNVGSTFWLVPTLREYIPMGPFFTRTCRTTPLLSLVPMFCRQQSGLSLADRMRWNSATASRLGFGCEF